MYVLEIIFYSLIPHFTTICYVIATFKPIFFRIPGFTNRKLEENIKKGFDDLITKTNITKNIQFRIMSHSQFCSARGINLFNPCIFIPPKLSDVDKDILSFIIKHELAHIKNNDCFLIPFLGLLINISLRSFISFLEIKSVTLNFLPHLIPLIAIILLSRRQEKKADEYAINNSNQKELESAIIFFKALQSLNPYDQFSDFLHPSLSTRISNIENILYGTSLEKKIDMVKINEIRDLIIEVLSSN